MVFENTHDTVDLETGLTSNPTADSLPYWVFTIRACRNVHMHISSDIINDVITSWAIISKKMASASTEVR